jgi:anti-sigma B factor antagonist
MALPQEPLLISVDRPRPGVAVVVPNGELDLANQQKLRDAVEGINDEAVPFLIVDLRRLRFMDSSGLRVLIDAYNNAAAGDGRFAVVAPESGIIRKLLEVSGCAKIFRVAAQVPDLLTVSEE